MGEIRTDMDDSDLQRPGRSGRSHANPTLGRALSSAQSFANTDYAMSGRLSQRDATLSLNDAGSLRLAIVADTHSHPHPKAAQWIGKLAPDAILHAGDIGDLEVLDQLGKLAPVIAVRGNIDERAPHLPDVVTLDIRFRGESAIKILLMHIVFQARAQARGLRDGCNLGAVRDSLVNEGAATRTR